MKIHSAGLTGEISACLTDCAARPLPGLHGAEEVV